MVDLGTLNWSYTNNGKFYVSVGSIDFGNNYEDLCSIYNVGSYEQWTNASKDKIIFHIKISKAIYVRDTLYTNADDFKIAMSGVLLFYKKAS